MDVLSLIIAVAVVYFGIGATFLCVLMFANRHQGRFPTAGKVKILFLWPVPMWRAFKKWRKP